MKYRNSWSILSAILFVLMLFISFLTHAQKAKGSPTSPTYEWEQVLPFGNGSFQEEWKPGTFPLGLTPLLAFHGQLWMVGQKLVWSSADGVKWSHQKKNDWGERISMKYAYYQDKLWMFGGMKYKENQFLNEIWFSADGATWEHAGHAEWPARKGHTVVAFKNRLWLFGGAVEVLADKTPSKFLNDVWSTKDGLHWEQEMKAAPWSPRDEPNVLVFNDTLYMIGGQGHADIWKSADGKKWTLLTSEAEWRIRYDKGALVFDNKLWVFGGRDPSPNHNTAAKNDVWYSTDGVKWTKQTEHAPWTVRSGGNSVVYKNRLWIFSGKHTAGKYNWGGDIWTMRKTNIE